MGSCRISGCSLFGPPVAAAAAAADGHVLGSEVENFAGFFFYLCLFLHLLKLVETILMFEIKIKGSRVEGDIVHVNRVSF